MLDRRRGGFVAGLQGRSARAAAQGAKLAQRDGEKPGREAPTRIVTREIEIRLDHRLLHGVFDVSGVGGAAGKEAEEAALVPDHELVEGTAIARQGARDELLIREQLVGRSCGGFGFQIGIPNFRYQISNVQI